jgi:predicted TIM-barrel fold metal-dependent hydrolase
MMIVFHAGRDIGFPPPVKTTPDILLSIIDRIPDLKLVAAHLGGWKMWDEVAKKLVGTPIYFDTAFISDFIDKNLTRDIIRAHGADKILFGSDAPWEKPLVTLEFLKSLGIDNDDFIKISGINAAGLLGI